MFALTCLMIDQIDQTSSIDTVYFYYFIIQTIFEQYFINEAIVLVKRNTNEGIVLEIQTKRSHCACLNQSQPHDRPHDRPQ